MTVTSHSDKNKTLTIVVEGKFDFQSHLEFRESYENSNDHYDKYIVDLSKASSIDSSALGMLLLLRDFTGGKNSIEIIHADNDIARILEISNFESLFALKETV
jgi:anti-anti-sigma factor